MPPSGPVTLPFSLAVAALALASQPAYADTKIGVAAAVKNQVQGGNARSIAVGGSVFANERIKTGDAASAQFMFLDKTVMSMGPKAELVLDKYVFNPNKSGGQVVVNAVQGSMRFVTGSQNPTNYQIKTPVATLGIRGTVVDLAILRSQTFIGVVEGQLVVTFFDGTTLTIGKGQYIIISGTTKTVIGSGPYNGSDPTTIEMVDWNRINEIDQLNAIIGRNYQAPVVKEVAPPCMYSCYMIGH